MRHDDHDDDHDNDDDDDCGNDDYDRSSPCEWPSSPKLLVSPVNILHLITNMIKL